MDDAQQTRPLLRALIVEDSEDDALLLADHLRSDYNVEWKRVENESALVSAMQEKAWDIVFSDYTMPNFTGMRAINVIREYDPDVPLIFVSGTMGEEVAVKAMKSGAQDFFAKGALARLSPAVQRELREARLRRKSRLADQARARLVAILEATPDMVGILDPFGCLRYLNSAGYSMLKMPTDTNIEEYCLQDLFTQPTVDDLVESMLAAVEEHGKWRGETMLKTVDNKNIPVSQVVLAHRDNQGAIEYLSTIARDISERISLESELQHRATHDSLTDLPNRFLLLDRFDSAIKNARRHGGTVAIMFLDMDNFKRINDTLGHATGDKLLQEFSRRLLNCLRPGDTVARHGGDEFSILISNLDHPELVLSILRKLRKEFERPVIIGSHQVYITFSVGIAMYPHDGEVVEDLLRHADTAMYKAKSSGYSKYCFYAPEMNARGNELLTLETELRHALENNEFHLHYQPQIDLRSGRIVGLEALIRWQHPTRGLVSPADFISLLENSGMIIPVGEWVMRQACKQLSCWHESGHKIRISVNVSASQFSEEDLLQKIRRIIAEEQVPKNALELEITEHTVMRDPLGTADVLRTLRDMGVRIAIDDFGTGYSSLAYLKSFPLNVLKIDQTFVSELGQDQDGAIIVEASISLGQKLGLEVIAEGVETRQQLEFLSSYNCDAVQGFYFSTPLTADDITAMLDKTWNW